MDAHLEVLFVLHLLSLVLVDTADMEVAVVEAVVAVVTKSKQLN